MRAHRAVLAAILLGLLTSGLPVLAEDATSSVRFDGVGFGFDALLGTSVNITQVPGQPTDTEQPTGPEAPHLAFVLYGTQPEATKVPKASTATGSLRVYPTAALAGYEQASAELEALTALLGERPDLSSYMQVSSDGSGDALPYLPVVPAAQVIRARAQYIDTPEVAGVAYLTAFRQDASPFAAGDFWYTFQGVSADGAWYVAADFVVEASPFPAEPSARESRRIADPSRYAEYLTDSVARLIEAPPDAFTPPLSSIDALVRSIDFTDAATLG